MHRKSLIEKHAKHGKELIPCPTCGKSYKKNGMVNHRRSNKACLAMRNHGCAIRLNKLRNVCNQFESDVKKKYTPEYVICARCNKRFTKRGLPRHLVFCLKNLNSTCKCKNCGKMYTKTNFRSHICIVTNCINVVCSTA